MQYTCMHLWTHWGTHTLKQVVPIANRKKNLKSQVNNNNYYSNATDKPCTLWNTTALYLEMRIQINRKVVSSSPAFWWLSVQPQMKQPYLFQQKQQALASLAFRHVAIPHCADTTNFDWSIIIVYSMRCSGYTISFCCRFWARLCHIIIMVSRILSLKRRFPIAVTVLFKGTCSYAPNMWIFR